MFLMQSSSKGISKGKFIQRRQNVSIRHQIRSLNGGLERSGGSKFGIG